MHQENRRAPRRRGPKSHAHTGTQSLSRKRRDVCREGDTALQRLKYRNTVRSRNVRIRAAVELKTPKAAGVYARGLRLFPLISKDRNLGRHFPPVLADIAEDKERPPVLLL